jgi:lipid-binding SYLF domain-containing protein
LQAGVQTFSYVLFFMTPPSLNYLQSSDGWAIASGLSVVVLDKGAAASITSTTLTQHVYAIPFGQRGLMSEIGLEGSKITTSPSVLEAMEATDRASRPYPLPLWEGVGGVVAPQ